MGACEQMAMASALHEPSEAEIVARMAEVRPINPRTSDEDLRRGAIVVLTRAARDAIPGKIMDAAAAHWPIVEDPDLKSVLKRMAREGWTRQDGLALQSMCNDMSIDWPSPMHSAT